MIEANNIYNEDCLIGMKKIPNKSIDLICSDPPYQITQNNWDSTIPFDLLWDQYKRIIKDNGAIVLTGCQPFTSKVIASNPEMFRYELIWEKTTATGHLNAKRMPLRAHENILVFYKRLPTYNPQMTQGHKRRVSSAKHGRNSKRSENYNSYQRTSYDSTERYPRSVLTFSTDRQKNAIHPTQKPVELFRYLIRTFTNEGDIVLDSFSGSGTTAEACILENRKFICIEKEKKYYDMSIARIANISSQMTLL